MNPTEQLDPDSKAILTSLTLNIRKDTLAIIIKDLREMAHRPGMKERQTTMADALHIVANRLEQYPVQNG